MAYIRLYRCAQASSHDKGVEEVACKTRRTNLDPFVRDLLADLDRGLLVVAPHRLEAVTDGSEENSALVFRI